MLLGTRTGRGAGFPGRHDAPYHPAFGMARDSFMGLRHSENAYLGGTPQHEIGHLRCARPTPGGTPSISPIPPEALVVVDVAEAASLRLSLVALTMLAAIPVRAHS
jgi:hypothetical protein